jgi:hypothetical protein
VREVLDFIPSLMYITKNGAGISRKERKYRYGPAVLC